MSEKMRVLALFDTESPKERGCDFAEEFKGEEWKSEAQVTEALRGLGHEVRMLGLFDDIQQLIDEVREFPPKVVFNLMEEFNGDHTMVANVVSVLEALGVAYTGARPLCLRLCKDKALCKAVMRQQGILTPDYAVLERGRKISHPSGVDYPLVVKPNINDASYGIAQASVVNNEEQLQERVAFLHEKTGQDALVERYVSGREIYISLLGTRRTRVFPLREVRFGELSEGSGQAIASYKVKWDAEYRKKWGIDYVYVEDMEESLVRKVEDSGRAAFKALQLNGYARIDLRLNPDGEPYILEVNPNPFIAKDEDFGQSAEKAGLPWESLIQSILNDALGTYDSDLQSA